MRAQPVRSTVPEPTPITTRIRASGFHSPTAHAEAAGKDERSLRVWWLPPATRLAAIACHELRAWRFRLATRAGESKVSASEDGSVVQHFRPCHSRPTSTYAATRTRSLPNFSSDCSEVQLLLRPLVAPRKLLYSPGMAATRSSRALGGLVARPPELAVRVGFNGLAQLAPVVVAFALTPLLLNRLGLNRFSIWSLALVILATLTALDGGVSASLARFFAIYAVRADRADTGRLLLGSLLLFLLLGLGLTVAVLPIAPAIVGLLDVPERLNGEAVFVLRSLPPLTALALMAASTSALLQGNGQFRALAATMLASSGTFAVAVIVFVHRALTARSNGPTGVATLFSWLRAWSSARETSRSGGRFFHRAPRCARFAAMPLGCRSPLSRGSSPSRWTPSSSQPCCRSDT